MPADNDPVWHRPLGSGHPYRIDPDQRHPVVPIVGESFELRVLATAGIDAVWLDAEPSSESPVDGRHRRCLAPQVTAPGVSR